MKRGASRRNTPPISSASRSKNAAPVESGTQAPTDTFLADFCQAFGLAPADVLGDAAPSEWPESNGYRVLGSGLAWNQDQIERLFKAVYDDKDTRYH